MHVTPELEDKLRVRIDKMEASLKREADAHSKTSPVASEKPLGSDDTGPEGPSTPPNAGYAIPDAVTAVPSRHPPRGGGDVQRHVPRPAREHVGEHHHRATWRPNNFRWSTIETLRGRSKRRLDKLSGPDSTNWRAPPAHGSRRTRVDDEFVPRGGRQTMADSAVAIKTVRSVDPRGVAFAASNFRPSSVRHRGVDDTPKNVRV